MDVNNGFVICLLLCVWCLGSGHSYMHDPCGAYDGSCNSVSQSVECTCRTYVFALVVIPPYVFLNPDSGEIEGPLIEILRKICEIAGKLCDFATADLINCWNGRYSEVLHEEWYDACVSLADLAVRKLIYAFPKIPFSKIEKPLIYVRKGANITVEDLRKPNEYHMGWITAPQSLLNRLLDAYQNNGFFIKNENIVMIDEPEPTKEINNLFDALDCGQIDIMLMMSNNVPPKDFNAISELDVDLGWTSMMVRKDNQCLLKWFEEAYEQFICSDEYPEFCQQLNESQDNATDYCQDYGQICS